MKKNASRGKSNASMEKADNGLKAYVLSGLGISIVSTSRGVLSDRKCREERVGGELLCTVH